MTALGEALAAISARAGAPSSVTFIVTQRCNYDCVHCYQEHDAKPQLSFEDIDRILGELADAGVLMLTLMGGEFFMHPNADDILRRARDLGFAIRLKTTGHHISEKRADFMATLKPLQVELSMYAAQAHLHEEITQQPGSWKRTFAAAQRLVKRGIRVQLNAPVTEDTAEDADNLRALAKELGSELSFDPKITSMENGDQGPVSLRMEQDTLSTFYDGLGPHLKSTYGQSDLSKELRPHSATPCRVGQLSVTINELGHVQPCNALPLSCGDLKTQSFLDIWKNSQQLADVRNLNWGAISECSTCELRNFCDRCHAMAMLEQGDIAGPSLEACRHAVAVRDALRDQGLLPPEHTVMPPTWDKVDPHGQHAAKSSRRLRVLNN